VRGSHDWPDYTIAAQLLNNLGDIFTYSLLPAVSGHLPPPCHLFHETGSITYTNLRSGYFYRRFFPLPDFS
jgi:hypothetical protein